MKKIIVFGGGTGLSVLLSGLKQFPIDVTTVITVSDNGSSTGVLKEELDIPAVGDVGKVLISMANVDEDFVRLLRYRFSKDGSLHNHPVRNIMLAALIDLKGSLSEATSYMCRLLNVKGTVLPLTEEKVELVGKNGKREYFGQVAVSRNVKNIRKLDYDHSIHADLLCLQHRHAAGRNRRLYGRGPSAGTEPVSEKPESGYRTGKQPPAGAGNRRALSENRRQGTGSAGT